MLDQLGHPIHLPAPPRRIVSLVPSQTELLFDLGLDEEIVGVTRFCTHPREKCAARTRVGGTKDFRLDVIQSLQPDLIIGNREENDRERIEQLRAQYPVWMSDIVSLEDALSMILSVGILVDKIPEATQIAHTIRVSFQELEVQRNPLANPPTVAYFIWRKPYMAAASGTFIDTMLAYCGLENVFGNQVRYPQITAEQLRDAQPQWIFLSSEPYPFKEKHLAEFQNLCPAAQIRLVDGEMFSWYGSRLQKSAAYFREVLSLE